MKYRPEIDGLRSIAVLSVIFYHAGFAGFGGGYVGVDVFFVISGYLITSIVCAELIDNRFSFFKFYERRFRRIVPALLVVLFFSSIAAWTTLGSDSIRDFSRSLLSSVFFFSNVYFYLTTGYFSAASDNIPLLHTWSLSVEEQYYIFAPFLLLLLVRRGFLFSVVTISFLCVLGLLFTNFIGVNYREAAFFLLPFRAWELMVGAAVALCKLRDAPVIKYEPWISSWLAMLGMLMIFYAILVYDETYFFPGGAAILPVGGAALIIYFANQKSGVGYFLSLRPFVFIGLLSYSAYLWHQPLFAIYRLNNGDYGVAVGVLLVLIVFALSWFSWRYVEQPARDKDHFSTSGLIRIASLCTLGICFLAVLGGYSRDARGAWVEFRMGADRAQREFLVNSHSDYDLYDFMASTSECVFWQKSIDDDFERKYSECAKKFGPGVVVLGDSHAMNLYNVIAKSRYFNFVVGVSQGYCRITDGGSQCQYKDFEEFFFRHKSDIRSVVYHQTGNPMLTNADGQFDIKGKYDGSIPLVVDESAVLRVFSYLERFSNDSSVYWFGPWVEPQKNKIDIVEGANSFNLVSQRIFKILDENIIRLSSKYSNSVRYVSMIGFMSDDGLNLWHDRCLMFRDRNHLSRCGEDFWSRRIDLMLPGLISANN